MDIESENFLNYLGRYEGYYRNVVEIVESNKISFNKLVTNIAYYKYKYSSSTCSLNAKTKAKYLKTLLLLEEYINNKPATITVKLETIDSLSIEDYERLITSLDNIKIPKDDNPNECIYVKIKKIKDGCAILNICLFAGIVSLEVYKTYRALKAVFKDKDYTKLEKIGHSSVYVLQTIISVIEACIHIGDAVYLGVKITEELLNEVERYIDHKMK